MPIMSQVCCWAAGYNRKASVSGLNWIIFHIVLTFSVVGLTSSISCSCSCSSSGSDRSFFFEEAGDYLEDLMACIDAPRLNCFIVIIFNDIAFNTQFLVQFINRAPMRSPVVKAYLSFRNVEASSCLFKFVDNSRQLGVRILSKESDWLLSSMV